MDLKGRSTSNFINITGLTPALASILQYEDDDVLETLLLEIDQHEHKPLILFHGVESYLSRMESTVLFPQTGEFTSTIALAKSKLSSGSEYDPKLYAKIILESIDVGLPESSFTSISMDSICNTRLTVDGAFSEVFSTLSMDQDEWLNYTFEPLEEPVDFIDVNKVFTHRMCISSYSALIIDLSYIERIETPITKEVTEYFVNLCVGISGSLKFLDTVHAAGLEDEAHQLFEAYPGKSPQQIYHILSEMSDEDDEYYLLRPSEFTESEFVDIFNLCKSWLRTDHENHDLDELKIRIEDCLSRANNETLSKFDQSIVDCIASLYPTLKGLKTKPSVNHYESDSDDYDYLGESSLIVSSKAERILCLKLGECVSMEYGYSENILMEDDTPNTDEIHWALGICVGRAALLNFHSFLASLEI